MDVTALLVLARQRARLTQRELAERSGVSKSALTTYESGRRSPTVAVLDTLLASCGLQLPDRLEPRHADIDLLLQQLLTGEPELDMEQVARVAASLEDRVADDRSPAALRLPRSGPVTWALDGDSALVAHGLAAHHPAPQVVVLLDEALRYWLQAVGLRGTAPQGWQMYDSWLEVEPERLLPSLHGLQLCRLGVLQVRVVEELPPLLRIVVPGPEPLEVPVLPLHDVEAAHPHLRAVLGRYRERSAAALGAGGSRGAVPWGL